MRRNIALLAALVLTVGGIASAQQGPVKVKEEKPGLLRQATITPEAAVRTALAEVPNGKIESAEIEKEDGKLVYSFDIKVAGQRGVEEVLIDAQTGKLVSKEHETPDDEKAEKSGEHEDENDSDNNA